MRGMRPRLAYFRIVLSLVTFLLAVACGPPPRGDGDDDGIGDPCTAGQTSCDGQALLMCEDGRFVTSQNCPAACDATLGCVVCVPGTGTCGADKALTCNSDGTGYIEQDCTPELGLSCDVETGRCDGACSVAELGSSYIGCEYYPTVTGNLVESPFNFAVTVSNTSGSVATITVDGGALGTPLVFTVEPNSVAVQTLPWVVATKLCLADNVELCREVPVTGALAAGAAYRLRSTQPVTVYQFNPLEYASTQGTFSYTNDASLLLPSTAWGKEFVTAGYTRIEAQLPGTPSNNWPSLVVVTARDDNTQVTVTTRAPAPGGGGAPAFVAGVPQTVTLNRGTVLELGTFGTGTPDDLTGTTVTADKPVQVFGAHYCGYVPDTTTGACDHMEETMLPVEALSNRYLITVPTLPDLAAWQAQARIIATAPGTTITYDPAIGAPATLANVGDYLEFTYSSDVMITSNTKVLVVTYMQGQPATSSNGDPAMAVAIPIEQYRDAYLFHAPVNYAASYVNVTATAGATIVLDGQMISGLTPIGGSGFVGARVALGPGTAGNHTIMGSMPFGITVYGYGSYTSYWYPGGSNLDLIDLPD
jgi:hypothetical protein